MYYQNCDDYMRDVFYFNQMPNQNFNYPYMGCNLPNSGFGANNGTTNFNNVNPDINNMYPSIYRIIQPVVSRVVTGNNYGYITEDNLNSMVDTVYNIVEGDVVNNSSEDASSMNNSSTQTQSQTQRNNNCNTQTTTQNTASSRVNDNNQDSRNLLRDLIKILLIKEILRRNNIRRFANNGFNNFQNMPNYYDQRYMF